MYIYIFFSKVNTSIQPPQISGNKVLLVFKKMPSHFFHFQTPFHLPSEYRREIMKTFGESVQARRKQPPSGGAINDRNLHLNWKFILRNNDRRINRKRSDLGNSKIHTDVFSIYAIEFKYFVIFQVLTSLKRYFVL